MVKHGQYILIHVSVSSSLHLPLLRGHIRLGAYRFLSLSLPWYPPYSRIVETLRRDSSSLFLDLGCCIAQELRFLASEGVPSTQLLGADLDPSFFDLGYNLFCDRETFKADLMRANILDDLEKSDIGKYEGKISFIFVGAFLHLFSWENQIVALSHIIHLLRPESGVMVLGRQVGNINPGHYTRKSVPDRNFHHDVGTFKELWMQVGR